jgi:hypothetical protein
MPREHDRANDAICRRTGILCIPFGMMALHINSPGAVCEQDVGETPAKQEQFHQAAANVAAIADGWT